MIMIDIETLGLAPGALIPSIGYCYFDWDGIKDHGSLFIDLTTMPGKVDVSTLKFWLKQSPEAIDKTFFREDVRPDHFAVVLSMLRDKIAFSQKYGTGVWGNGDLFDLGHLAHWYRVLGDIEPWGHREPRDMRTFIETAERFASWSRENATAILRADHPQLTKHDAESDAVLQALLVIDANKALSTLTSTPRPAPVQYPRDAIDAG